MINIKLNYNYGYKWFSSDNIYVKGYIFDEQNNLYKDKELISFFQNISNEDEFKNRLIQANGIFSVIIKQNDILMMAVDRTRTFPLFYSSINDDIYISDDTYYLKDIASTNISKLSVDEFLATGYVTGEETLLKNIFQLQAGEYLVYQEDKIFKNFYSDYITTLVSDKSFDTLKNNFLEILDNSIKRLINFADGKQIVLPLSGGYDSRLIAALLKKHNYENVFCFTYGSKDSFEVEISQKVAKKLEYSWYFIEYNEQTVPQDYPQSKKFQEYYKYASNHVSIFLTQDYFAIKYLYDNNLIDNHSVIAPGHSGDFLGGSHLSKTKIVNHNNIINCILDKHYILNKLKYKESIKEKIIKNLTGVAKDKFYYSQDENFNLKERQSKFIVNANRVYEYFGYTHTIPLWDLELIVFFRILPLEYKLNSYFYEKVIIEDIFESLDIGYKKKIIKKTKIKLIAKDILKKIIPNSLKTMIISRMNVDINNFYLQCNPIQKEVKRSYSIHKINSLLSSWYIQKVKNEENN